MIDPMTGPVLLSRDGAVAIITIDNPPVNALSRAVRTGLLAALAQAEADPMVSSGVLRCAGRTFVAGADISEMDSPPMEPFLPDVVDAFERSRIFWVAALHGNALGGGLELALACHERVAQTGTRLGLPEVSLGIIPGAGGTVRLTGLIGGEAASRLVTSGKPVDAAEAQVLGLIDALAGDAVGEALARARTGRAGMADRRSPPQPLPEFWAHEAGRIRARSRGQDAPLVALLAVRDAATMPRAEAMNAERARFLLLRQSEQAAALRHMFFAERKAGKSLRSVVVAPDPASVGIVGGGTMGSGIATAFLLAGVPVVLVERDETAAARARSLVRSNLEESARRGIIADADATCALLLATTAYADLACCPLVIEAVFEDLAAKREVFGALDAVVGPDAILATNTSYLDVGEIAAATRHPERVLGLHFFAPAHVMKLLEVVRTPLTGDAALAMAAAIARRLRKVAVVAGVCDGFIGNRIMSVYRGAAEDLLIEGASPEDVDVAMREYGFAAGIFETQDLSGLDIAWAMRKRRRLEGREPQTRTIGDAMCEAGRLGRKTSAGWYDYVDGQKLPSEETGRIIDSFRAQSGGGAPTRRAIVERIIAAMVGEARCVLAENIAEDVDDIDVVMVNGFGFPRFRGGPMFASRRAGGEIQGEQRGGKSVLLNH
jgi:3-hydroxyacyl-CoA dehydrogenase